MLNRYQEALKTVKKSCISVAMEFNLGKLFEEDEKALSTLQELVDKATPKKPKYELNEHCHIDELCPVCNRTVASYDNYCGKCGQRIGGLRS